MACTKKMEGTRKLVRRRREQYASTIELKERDGREREREKKIYTERVKLEFRVKREACKHELIYKLGKRRVETEREKRKRKQRRENAGRKEKGLINCHSNAEKCTGALSFSLFLAHSLVLSPTRPLFMYECPTIAVAFDVCIREHVCSITNTEILVEYSTDRSG